MDASALVRLVVPQDQRMPFLEGGEFFFVNIPAISPLQVRSTTVRSALSALSLNCLPPLTVSSSSFR